jgi:hypothetical protein
MRPKSNTNKIKINQTYENVFEESKHDALGKM